MGFFGGGLFSDPVKSGLKTLLQNNDREKIEEYQQKAQDKLDEAELLRRDELVPLQHSLQRKAERIGLAYEQQTNFKINLVQKLNGDVSNTIAKFKQFNIDAHIIEKPDLTISPSSNNMNITSTLTSSILPMNTTPPLLSLFFGSNSELSEAKKAYAKAKKYLLQVEEAIDKLHNVKIKLNDVEEWIQEEKNTLCELDQKLRNILIQLEQAMKRDKFSREEAEYMKALCGIAEFLKKSLKTQVTNSSGELEYNYRQYVRKLNDINYTIPSAPKLSTGKSWMERLARQVSIYES